MDIQDKIEKLTKILIIQAVEDSIPFEDIRIEYYRTERTLNVFVIHINNNFLQSIFVKRFEEPSVSNAIDTVYDAIIENVEMFYHGARIHIEYVMHTNILSTHDKVFLNRLRDLYLS